MNFLYTLIVNLAIFLAAVEMTTFESRKNVRVDRKAHFTYNSTLFSREIAIFILFIVVIIVESL